MPSDEAWILAEKLRDNLTKLSGMPLEELEKFEKNPQEIVRNFAADLQAQGDGSFVSMTPFSNVLLSIERETNPKEGSDMPLNEFSDHHNFPESDSRTTTVQAQDTEVTRNPESAAITLQQAKEQLMARLQDLPVEEVAEEHQLDTISETGAVADGSDPEYDEDGYASLKEERGLLTDIPLILGPTEIEALPMIIQAGIVDHFGPRKTGGRNLQAVRCKLLLAQKNGRNLLRELLIFIAAWDLPDDDIYFKMMTQIMESVLKVGLMPLAYNSFGQAKDIISPAQAVMIKILTNIFRAKHSVTAQDTQRPGTYGCESSINDIFPAISFFRAPKAAGKYVRPEYNSLLRCFTHPPHIAPEDAPAAMKSVNVEPSVGYPKINEKYSRLDVFLSDVNPFPTYFPPLPGLLVHRDCNLNIKAYLKASLSTDQPPVVPTKMEVHVVRYIFTVFRGSIVPETCALIYLQGQIRAGNALPEDFPLNLWDMERVYEGIYQFLEFFAVLTESPQWKSLIVDWQIVYELVTLLRELDLSIPKAPMTVPNPSIPSKTEAALLASEGLKTNVPVVAVERPYDPAPDASASDSDEAAMGAEDPAEFEWRNLKKLVVLVLSSLVWKSRKVQDQVRQYGGIEMILQCCNYDNNNPYIREHAIMCLRFMLDQNAENKKVIQELEAKKVVPGEVFDKMPFEPYMDEQGKVKLRRKEPIPRFENTSSNATRHPGSGQVDEDTAEPWTENDFM